MVTEGYTDGRQNEICEKVYISFGTLIKSNIRIITKDQHLSCHGRMFQIFTQASKCFRSAGSWREPGEIREWEWLCFDRSMFHPLLKYKRWFLSRTKAAGPIEKWTHTLGTSLSFTTPVSLTHTDASQTLPNKMIRVCTRSERVSEHGSLNLQSTWWQQWVKCHI